MAFTDDLAILGAEFVAGLGGDTGITITREAPGAFNPASQTRERVGTPYTVANFVRSASQQVQVSMPGGGGFIRVEEFSYSVTLADLVAAGMPDTGASQLFDENTTVTDGTEVYRVVAVHRECGESVLRFIVRRDMGEAA